MAPQPASQPAGVGWWRVVFISFPLGAATVAIGWA